MSDRIPGRFYVLCHQYRISVAETQMFLCTKRPSSEERGGTAVFAGYWFHCEMITEEVAQKFHTDDVLPLRSASD